MVKTITIHKCEICSFSYDYLERAFNCEKQGVEKPVAEVGDIVDYFRDGIEGWDSVDTHLTDLVMMEIKPNESNPHYLEYVLGWVSDEGRLIADLHASIDNNYEFEKYCTIKFQ